MSFFAQWWASMAAAEAARQEMLYRAWVARERTERTEVSRDEVNAMIAHARRKWAR